MRPCPVCDIVTYALEPMSALALGVSLGVGFGDMHRVTVMCCEQHRPLYVTGMMKASIVGNTVDDPTEPGGAA